MMRSVARRRSPPIWKLRARRSPRSPTPRKPATRRSRLRFQNFRAEKEKASTARDELERARAELVDAAQAGTTRERELQSAVATLESRLAEATAEKTSVAALAADLDAARDELAAAVASNAAREEEALEKLREKETKLATLAEVDVEIGIVAADDAEIVRGGGGSRATLEDEIARLREKISAMSSEMEAKDAAVARTTTRRRSRVS